MRGTIAVSWGRYGGFYLSFGYTKRICLGCIAFTYIPEDFDDLLTRLLKAKGELLKIATALDNFKMDCYARMGKDKEYDDFIMSHAPSNYNLRRYE